MSSLLGDAYGYFWAAAAWSGLLCLGSIPLLVVACKKISRQNDIARVGFLWLKVALSWFIVSMAMRFGQLLATLLFAKASWEPSTNTVNYTTMLNRLSVMVSFFTGLCDLSTLSAAFLIALGFFHTWDISPKARVVLRRCVYGFIVLSILIAVTVMIGKQVMYTKLSDGDWRSHIWELRAAFTCLQLAFVSLQLVGAVATFVVAVIIKIKANRQKTHPKATTLFLVSGIMLFICYAWLLVQYMIPFSYYGTIESLLYMFLCQSTQFIALVLMTVIGPYDNATGIWSPMHHDIPKAEAFSNNSV